MRAVFAQEQFRLLALPDNPFLCEEREAVKVSKTPYVRFDLNDYSVPHTHVRRFLSVVASPTEVGVLDGAELIARHRRRYDRGAPIEDEAHIAALTAHKRQAREHRGQDRLAQAAPSSRSLLLQAAERGDNRGAITAALRRLLERYGAAELETAITEARARGVPHPNAVRLSLERRREHRSQQPPLAVALPADPRLHGVVRLYRLDDYDQLQAPPQSEKHHESNPYTLKTRAKALKLYGLLAHWEEIPESAWIETLIGWEEQERARRGLERHLRNARLGRFKPLVDCDWHWPTRGDRAAVEALMGLGFLQEPANAVLIGPNGVGKSTLACHIAPQALLAGHTVLFTSAAQMLNEHVRHLGAGLLSR